MPTLPLSAGPRTTTSGVGGCVRSQVIEAAFNRGITEAGGKKRPICDRDLDNAVDEAAVDQTKQYTDTRNRWFAQSLVCARDVLWWRVGFCMRRIRSPLVHHSSFLKSRLTDDELDARGGHLAQLATGKARAILNEWDSLLESPAWAVACVGLDEHDSAFLLECVVRMILFHHEAYYSRVVQKVEECPGRLFKFILVPQDVYCEARQREAKLVLETDVERLHCNIRKLRVRYAADLALGASRGYLGVKLYTALVACRIEAEPPPNTFQIRNLGFARKCEQPPFPGQRTPALAVQRGSCK